MGVKDGCVLDVSDLDDNEGDQEVDVGDGLCGQVQIVGCGVLGFIEEYC